ncbi:hypothetical protein [Gallionella capsiferriformans]|uniref:Lipoprotein n=1 Tax=Gallionella capsiferriformans (strain ES-2) TaxID=395494 RepID=D9SGM4_GALCS|nr:hypothetical protein [Gallionella capsiferriformans]ADL55671.1 hypothetical protein Galf_1657 [Gallionella capsiferriformans ES-2]
MKRIRMKVQLINAFTVAMMLAACSGVTAHKPTLDMASCPTPSGYDIKLHEALLYAAYIRSLSASDLTQEYNAARMNIVNNTERLKLAILLSLPDTQFRDTGKAIGLLNGLTVTPSDSQSDLNGFALLLNMLLGKEQQTAETLSDLTKLLATDRAQIKSLQDKIDAIKDFETNQTHRDQP